MRRREFITLLGSVAAAWPRAGWAQRTHVLGVLGSTTPESRAPRLAVFKNGSSWHGIAVIRQQ